MPARYGYEYLLLELSKKLNEKIHIHEHDVYEEYSLISSLDACVTTNSQAARIFLRPTYLKVNQIKPDERENFLNLQLSAMFWANWNGGSFVQKTDRNSYRVCYATHSSYNEIRDFLLYLKPRKVYLNVLPADCEERLQMLQQLNLIQQHYFKTQDEEVSKAATSITKTKFSFTRIRSISNSQQVDKQTKP